MATTLNPYLILQGQQPQSVNPLNIAESVGRIQALQRQQAMAPTQMAQQQANLQSTQLANQTTQRNIDEQKQFGQLMADSGGDPDQMESIASKTITNPNVLDKVYNTASLIRQRSAAMTARQHDDLAKQNSMLASQAQTVIDAANDPTTQKALWGQFVTSAQNAQDEKGNPALPPGTLNPDVVPDNSTLATYQNWLDKSGAWHAQQEKLKSEAAETASRTTAAQLKQKQDARQDITAQYGSVISPEDHQNWLNYIQKNYPNVYAEYKDLPYDPETTPDIVKNKAFANQYQQSLAGARQQTADAATARAAVAGGRAGIVARMYDPNGTDATRAAAKQELADYDARRPTEGQSLAQQRYQERQAAADAKAHSTAYQNEQKQWGIAGKYSSALQAAGANENTTDPNLLNQSVKDPVTGHDTTVGSMISSLKTARTQAQGLQQTVDNLEKKNGWGSYGSAAPGAATPPAPPRMSGNPPNWPSNAPPAYKLKEGTATKFKNGQTWTLRNGQPVQLQNPGTPQSAPQSAGQ